VGVPVSNPVDVLKVIPAGADGEIENVAESPEFVTVYSEFAAEPTVADPDVEERVMFG
jgi:hypothetical protein